MSRLHRFGIVSLIVCAAILAAVGIPSVRSRAGSAQAKTQTAQKLETKEDGGEAFRNNTLGVAYMNRGEARIVQIPTKDHARAAESLQLGRGVGAPEGSGGDGLT